MRKKLGINPISIPDIFLTPHRDTFTRMQINVAEYSTLHIDEINISGVNKPKWAEICGDGTLIGSYDGDGANITLDISTVNVLEFRNGHKTTAWNEYAEFAGVTIS